MGKKKDRDREPSEASHSLPPVDSQDQEHGVTVNVVKVQKTQAQKIIQKRGSRKDNKCGGP